MAIEGLRVVLEKEAVVGTPTADQLVHSPEAVFEAFMRHVRSYVPFGRAGGATEDELSVADYEKRLITLVKEAKAPKGYITADFGYGKTSTALYLWHRCREAGVLAVPPFRLSKLDDLILATYGWARYEIGRCAPALIPQAEALFHRYSERSIEVDASGDEARADLLRDLMRQGRYTLALGAIDYLTFFEQIAELAREAGFAGVVVLPDEVQQYIEPSVRAGMKDPIAPLFDIVQAFVTRKGFLRVGLIFSIPSKELGVINDQRADLVQRLKMDGLGLDLRAVYDQGFAARLWRQLAREFGFEAAVSRIVEEATLDSLGQIAARDDLANGPRTVIAAFALLARRYLDAQGRCAPLSPIGLVDAFLAGEIVFDNVGKLQAIVQGHLASRVVAERAEYRDVIKLLGAFPTDGASRPVIEASGLWGAVDELSRLAQGDIVITVGGGRDNRGRDLPYGATLRGLEPSSAVASDWLTQTIREFRRSYVESAELTLQRAKQSFVRMLTTLVFRDQDWKVVERIGERLTDSAGILLEGQFRSTAKRFPERRVFVRLPGEGEPVRGDRDADATLDLILARHFDVDDQQRRRHPGTLEARDSAQTGRATLTLNLFHRGTDLFYTDLQATLLPVLSPWQLTPLLLLALDAYLEEKRRQDLIPKEDNREIAQSFQPLLLEHALDELFNSALGTPYGAARERIIEELLRRLWEARYPDYRTLIVQQSWRNALRDYQTALERLPSADERQGEEPYAGSKSAIARLFNRSNTNFDTFVAAFPELIAVTKPFRGQEAGAVQFRLHPLEGRVRELLRAGTSRQVRQGGQQLTARTISLAAAYDTGRALGYHQGEIDELLEIMGKRELVEVSAQRGEIREVVSPRLRVEDLQVRIREAARRVAVLRIIFPDEIVLQNQAKNLEAMAQESTKKPDTLDERTIRARTSTIRAYQGQLDQWLATLLDRLRRELRLVADRGTADLQSEYGLGRSLPAQFFGSQLDAQRATIAEQAASLRAKQILIQNKALDSLGGLRVDDPGDEAIVEGHRQLVALHQELKQIEADAGQLQGVGRNYAAARRVLEGMVELDQQLRLGLGGQVTDSTAPEAADAFDALQRRVAGELSSRKLAALEHAQQWEADLVSVRSLLGQHQRAQQEAFEYRRSRYLDLLHTFLGLPHGSQPLKSVYNPANPADSMRQLIGDVAQLLDTRARRLEEQLEKWLDGLRQLLLSPDLAETDAASGRLSAECRTLLDASGATLVDIRHLRRQAADPGLLEDVETEGGSCAAVLRSFAAVTGRIVELAQRHAALDAEIAPSKLDVSERALLDDIRQLLEVGHEEVEVGALLQTEARANESAALDSEEVWVVLESLYRKRRIRLHISLPDEARR